MLCGGRQQAPPQHERARLARVVAAVLPGAVFLRCAATKTEARE